MGRPSIIPFEEYIFLVHCDDGRNTVHGLRQFTLSRGEGENWMVKHSLLSGRGIRRNGLRTDIQDRMAVMSRAGTEEMGRI
ncbi:hypothetical protein CEXT_590231 [Caerostris extrusa]|uniref:Uncharacterized protein n=1 Tax=Caerostris extrusa TaxID=172846 RepID=A0AAV4PDT9_CAEEX|nr:hypothetical protein CEXT_590231 [Caerostris extrusa]